MKFPMRTLCYVIGNCSHVVYVEGKREAFLEASRGDAFLLYRKFLKSSEIVYNGLEIKNDMTKERM